MLTFTDVNVLKGKGASGRRAECCQVSGPWSGAQETCFLTPALQLCDTRRTS